MPGRVLSALATDYQVVPLQLIITTTCTEAINTYHVSFQPKLLFFFVLNSAVCVENFPMIRKLRPNDRMLLIDLN